MAYIHFIDSLLAASDAFGDILLVTNALLGSPAVFGQFGAPVEPPNTVPDLTERRPLC